MSENLLEKARQLCAQNDPLQALRVADEARRANPHDAQAYILIAQLFEKLGQGASARQVLEEGRKMIADDVALTNETANFFYRQNQPQEGLNFLQGWMLKKDCPVVLRLAYANLCKSAGRVDEALQRYQEILNKDPQNIFALSNLGGIYLDAREYEKAIVHFEKALAVQPENPHTATQLAYACFRNQRLREGWRHYQKRFEDTVPRRPHTQPEWKGEDIKNKTLLVWGEQGVGEEILHSTMYNDARARCGRLLVECDARLQPLFARSFPDIVFIARSNPPDARCTKADLQIPAGNLGGIFRNAFSDFPQGKNAQHFLKADSSKCAEIKARYEEVKQQRGLTGKIIGISWQSKPLRHGDPKSTKLADWEKIFENSPHLFINLQYGDVREEIAVVESRGWNLFTDEKIDQMKSLDDFAAQLAACDEVITVSNTTAHMAGALGVPAYVLLPQSRGLMAHWFDTINHSPWYSSLKLVRQNTDGDWREVLGDYLPNSLSMGR